MGHVWNVFATHRSSHFRNPATSGRLFSEHKESPGPADGNDFFDDVKIL